MLTVWWLRVDLATAGWVFAGLVFLGSLALLVLAIRDHHADERADPSTVFTNAVDTVELRRLPGRHRRRRPLRVPVRHATRPVRRGGHRG